MLFRLSLPCFGRTSAKLRVTLNIVRVIIGFFMPKIAGIVRFKRLQSQVSHLRDCSGLSGCTWMHLQQNTYFSPGFFINNAHGLREGPNATYTTMQQRAR